jgi:Ca2+/H+ antiporter, TMEM165/GDT1 family
VVPFS